MDGGTTSMGLTVDYKFVIIAIILGLLVVFVVCGNCLVIAAVFTSPKLRSVTNLFIASLATSDLLLGLLVLPSSATNEVVHYWIFGDLWCSMWLAVDVWMCTSQILNLCAISFDRWIAIQYPMKYPTLMSPRRGKILIASCWILAFIVCFPPLLGWNEKGRSVADLDDRHPTSPPDYEEMFSNWSFVFMDSYLNYSTEENATGNVTQPQCQLTSEPGYIVYSALGSFFLPCIVMMFFYFKIYRAAKKFTRNLRRGVMSSKGFNQSAKAGGETEHVTMRVHRGGGAMRKCQTLGSRPKSGSWADDFSINGSRSSLRGAGLNSCAFKNGLSRCNERPTSLVLCRAQSDRCFDLKNISASTSTTSPNSSPRSLNNGGKFHVRDNRAKTLMNMKFENSRSDLFEKHNSENNNGRVKRIPSPKQMIFSFISKHATDSHDRPIVRRHNRETKAAKTVAIIICAFIVCWGPFFTVYLIGAFCDHCAPPETVFKVIFWLGYCNSAINPCIYALFSRDYRHAFKKLLRCKVGTHRLLKNVGRGTYVTSLRVRTDSDQDHNSN